jgi:Snf7
MLEGDLTKWSNTKNTIEQQVFALENANINLETMKAMKAGADAMKGIHGSLYVCFLRNELTMLDLLRKWILLWTRFEIKWLCRMKSVKPLLVLL